MVWAYPANLSLNNPHVQDTNHLAQLAKEQFATNPSFWTRGLVPKLSIPGWRAQKDQQPDEIRLPLQVGIGARQPQPRDRGLHHSSF